MIYSFAAPGNIIDDKTTFSPFITFNLEHLTFRSSHPWSSFPTISFVCASFNTKSGQKSKTYTNNNIYIKSL